MRFRMKRLECVVGSIAFALVMLGSGIPLQSAELTPANIRMDFIIGGKHAPWYVALEKGFYAKRGLAATIQSSTGSADTVRTIGAGGADFGFADIGTTIVARSRGTIVVPMSRSEEHTSELQSQSNLVCRLLLEKKKKKRTVRTDIGSQDTQRDHQDSHR